MFFVLKLFKETTAHGSVKAASRVTEKETSLEYSDVISRPALIGRHSCIQFSQWHWARAVNLKTPMSLCILPDMHVLRCSSVRLNLKNSGGACFPACFQPFNQRLARDKNI